MINTRIASRYANALFDLAQSENRLDRIALDLHELSLLVNRSAELSHFLADPLRSNTLRDEIIAKLFKGKLDDLSFNFVLLLEEKHRMGHLLQICHKFDQLVCEYKRVLRINIVTAASFTTQQIISIKDKLKSKYGYDIEVTLINDDELLGGFKIFIGDTVLDFSLLSQLNRIKNNIINA